jgi:hypothetical protein
MLGLPAESEQNMITRADNLASRLDAENTKVGYKVCAAKKGLFDFTEYVSLSVLAVRVRYRLHEWTFRPRYRSPNPYPASETPICGALCVFSDLALATEFLIGQSSLYGYGEPHYVFQCDYIPSDDEAYCYSEIRNGYGQTALKKHTILTPEATAFADAVKLTRLVTLEELATIAGDTEGMKCLSRAHKFFEK